jgi:hypothetical protein
VSSTSGAIVTVGTNGTTASPSLNFEPSRGVERSEAVERLERLERKRVLKVLFPPAFVKIPIVGVRAVKPAARRLSRSKRGKRRLRF